MSRHFPQMTFPIDRGEERYRQLLQLFAVARRMSDFGIRIDMRRTRWHLEQAQARSRQFTDMFLQLSGLSPEALGPSGSGTTTAIRDYFWKTLELPPVVFDKKTKKPQFNTAALIIYAKDMNIPAAAALYGIRKAKTAERFAAAYLAVAEHSGGRIHFGFNPMGTKGERWSSAAKFRWRDPSGEVHAYSLNAQNVPAKEPDYEFEKGTRTKLALSMRDCFIPDPGCVFLKCVSPEMRVLTTDLRWVRADSLREDDELIAPEEYGTRVGRKLIRSRVTSVGLDTQPSYRIVTTHGTLTCSANHKWLRTGGRGEWVEAQALKVGDYLSYVLRPWDIDTSREGGWLAGFFDGEGYCTKTFGQVGYSQNPGSIAEYAESLLTSKGFQVGSGVPNQAGCITAKISGEAFANLRFLGSIRPVRLLSKAAAGWENKISHSKSTVRPQILEIEQIGMKPVVVLSTTSKTFICEGFSSHNCDYDQLELRLIAYTAGAQKLIDWINTGKDTHMENARGLFLEGKIQPHEKKTKKPRNQREADLNKWREAAKPCAYAISYQMPSGRGADKYPDLYKQLKQVFPDLPEPYVNVLVSRFFNLHPEIRRWQNNTARALEELGKIELKMTGAFLYLSNTSKGKNQALNFQMQSGGGALINRAIINIDKGVSWQPGDSAILAMVHDEVDAQAKYHDMHRVKVLIEQEMGAPAQIGETFAGIPAEADPGHSWNSCIKMDEFIFNTFGSPED